MWLVTRKRPDLMFSVARMAACVLRGPKKVQKVGAQTKVYLQGTKQRGPRRAKKKTSASTSTQMLPMPRAPKSLMAALSS